MINHRILFFILIFLSVQTVKGKEIREVENLRDKWMILKNNKFNIKGKEQVKSIHVSLDLAESRGQYLELFSHNKFYVFINSTLVMHGQFQCLLNSDSLRNLYSKAILLSVYQEQGIGDLTMKWVSFASEEDLNNPRRPPTAFSNFLLIAILVLIIFFTALFRTNPQLTLDYLNVNKLFYFKDRDNNQITLRIGSSVNLLFYLFCSLLASLALLTASQFSNGGLSFLRNSSIVGVDQYLGRWLLLAFAIASFLMLKMGFSTLLSKLFGWRDMAGFQFFNFVRVTILALMFIAGVAIFCFVFGITVEYFYLLKIICFLFCFGAGLIYFKLLARTPHRSFHLFSYLCVTEIFPLLICIKQLLF